jgi:hypothetical protein
MCLFAFGISQILYYEILTGRRCRQWFGKECLRSTPRKTLAKQRRCLMGGCSEVKAFHKENNS